MAYKKVARLKESSSPTVIQNSQHHDTSLSQKCSVGSPGTPELIIADSTVLTPIKDYATIRVTNTTASVAFIFIGQESDAPGGAPTIADGLALPPNSSENIFIGKLEDDSESVHVKASAATVQVVVFE